MDLVVRPYRYQLSSTVYLYELQQSLSLNTLPVSSSDHRKTADLIFISSYGAVSLLRQCLTV